MSEIKFPSSEEINAQQLNNRPGREYNMNTKPIFDDESYKGFKRLEGKTAVITGGDSGIGKAVAVAYAKEGCNVVIMYKEESKDAQDTLKYINNLGVTSLGIEGDISDPKFCKASIKKVIDKFHQIDILVNNATEQHPQKSILDISDEQLEQTFKTNIFS